MLPSNIYNHHHHPITNQSTANLLDFLEPSVNENSHNSSHSDKNINTPGASKQNSNDDLIKLVDDLNLDSQAKAADKTKGIADLIDKLYLTSQVNVVNKGKDIADIQLKILEEFVTTSKAPSKSVSAEQEVEFQSFFDRYEFNKPKPTMLTQLEHTDLSFFEPKPLPDGKCSFTCVSHVDVKPNILRKNFIEGNTVQINNDTTVNDVHFLTNLKEKTHNIDLHKQHSPIALTNLINMEKQQINPGAERPIHFNVPNQSTETVKTAYGSTTSDENHYTNIFEEILARNKIIHTVIPVMGNVAPDSMTEDVTNEPIKVPMTGIDKHNETCIKTKLEQKALTEELVTKYDIKYLEAVKKIDKTFKRSILKSDVEKSKLTRGPGLFEKTMVLPHIMHRLAERNKAVEEKSNRKMRLILEAGAPETTPIKDTQYSSIKTSPGLASSSKNVNSVKNNTSVNNSPLKSSVSSFVNSFSNAPVNQTIFKPPEVLLADCNKERLKAFKTGKILSKLVHKEDHYVPEYETP